MPIDTSIYQAIKPVQIDPMGATENAMKLSQLGLQMQTQQAMRQAYGDNIGQDGQLNQQGFINSIGRVNPQAAMQYQQHFAQMNKQKAEAQSAQADALDKQLSQVMPTLDYASKMPEEQRAAAWPKLMQTLRTQGVDTSRMGDTYDPSMFATALRNGQLAQAHLNALKSQAETTEKYASADKLRAETPHPMDLSKVTPDTDPATLVPHVVPLAKQKDVNEEIKKAQDISNLRPDILAAFEQASSRYPNTAANGRAKFESLINTTVTDLTGTARQAEFDNIHNNMTPSGLFARPGENDTKKEALLAYLSAKSSAPTAKGYGIDLKKFNSTSLGRGDGPGQQSAGTDYASKTAGSQDASANSQAQYRKIGSAVSADQLNQYAMKHKMTLSAAKDYLKGKGYAVGN